MRLPRLAANLPNTVSRNKRDGFTLLEVVLASVLSVVLLSALYMTLNMNYQYARAGREVLNETAVSRSVLTRLSDDIAGQLSPMDPILYAKLNGTTTTGNLFGGASGAAATSPSSSSPSSAGSSASSGSSNSGSSSGGSSANSSGNSGTTTTLVCNLGVFGDANRLVLTGSWLPKDLTHGEPVQTVTSDLRRVTYWMVRDGDKHGLARQELMGITGNDASTLPPDIPNPGSFVIAREVKDFSLEYYDGTTWQTSWDGTTLDTNTSLPIGPPAAIAINLTVSIPAAASGARARETKYRHVVSIPSANSQNQTTTPTTTP